jgi:hypothetical protein
MPLCVTQLPVCEPLLCLYQHQKHLSCCTLAFHHLRNVQHSLLARMVSRTAMRQASTAAGARASFALVVPSACWIVIAKVVSASTVSAKW